MRREGVPRVTEEVNGEWSDAGKPQTGEGGIVMNGVMVAMLVFVGVLAGVLAGYVMKRGGYGLRWDVILGLIGSVVGSWIFWTLRISPGAGLIALAVVAFVGATIAIVIQRLVRPRPWIWSLWSRR
jgi:uncharacterized membrane protein YeaQ/YmgE (transglycosylase-associated protein family)